MHRLETLHRLNTLREQIDACRKGSDDLSLPDLAELAQAVRHDRGVAVELDRSQQFDAAVVSAMHDVPVPGDLLQRLLDSAAQPRSVSLEVAVQQAAAATAPAGDGASETAAPATAARRGISRRWMIALATVAAVALVAVGVAPFLPRSGRDVTQNQLADAALHWHEDNFPRAEGWTAFAGNARPYSLLVDEPLRQRRYQTAHGPAIVYDLAPPGRQALLLVVTTRDKFPVRTSPYTPISVTGGLRVGAWQRENKLYVLIISPDGHHLDDYVRQPRAA